MSAAVSSYIGKLVLIICIALAAYAGLYLFFPEVHQRVTGSGGPSGEAEITIERLEEALHDSGAQPGDIKRIMDQIDAETLEEIAREAVQRGGETGVEVFEMLKNRIDFSGVDTQRVQDFFYQRTRDIDFPKAFQELEEGLESLGTRLMNMVTQ